ncbi:DEAD-box ATP-dependent RNA helicase 16 [Camellia lanceoleosa]|uniref:DEAD-box ATP-dependent RNA helicase 16 n=1 Tax=Camellia lanceoleosa TaxID=1840588 RepID=A0ACC0IVJ2_9ERIC|nr:DEAD-box ATP-dependent RNA helicase 16 [Camellia lanceoleosa]
MLIFTNTTDMSFRLKIFFEQAGCIGGWGCCQWLFRIKSAVLNAELLQNSRLHILEEFNVGLCDYLIATDGSHT